MTHAQHYFDVVSRVSGAIDAVAVERLADRLVTLRGRGGRLFLLGVGGSAANCSHAVNDFRKLAGLEAYSPCDNVSELTARTNDEGWDTVFAAWLKGSRLSANDGVLVFSVGGGDVVRNVSPNIVRALEHAKACGAMVLGIVGRDGGYTKQVGDEVIVVPTIDAELTTPIAEAFQAVVWHALVSHPALAVQRAKWESVSSPAAPPARA